MAMSKTLKVDPEVLITKSQNISAKNSSLDELVNSMKKTVDSLSGEVYTGADSEEFRSKFTAAQTSVKKVVAAIKDHSDDLKNVGESYKAALKRNKDAASSLSTSI